MRPSTYAALAGTYEQTRRPLHLTPVGRDYARQRGNIPCTPRRIVIIACGSAKTEPSWDTFGYRDVIPVGRLYTGPYHRTNGLGNQRARCHAVKRSPDLARTWWEAAAHLADHDGGTPGKDAAPPAGPRTARPRGAVAAGRRCSRQTRNGKRVEPSHLPQLI